VEGRQGGGQAEAPRVAAGVAQAAAAALVQDGAERPLPGVERRRARGRRRVHAAGDELPQAQPVRLEDADQGVASADDVPGRVAKAVQQAVRVALRREL
jgi:hypothetical protein